MSRSPGILVDNNQCCLHSSRSSFNGSCFAPDAKTNIFESSGVMGGKKKVCVIGSGVVGLTTAVKLLEECHPDVEVLLDINDANGQYSCEGAQ